MQFPDSYIQYDKKWLDIVSDEYWNSNATIIGIKISSLSPLTLLHYSKMEHVYEDGINHNSNDIGEQSADYEGPYNILSKNNMPHTAEF